MNTNLNNKSNGFIDCMRVLNTEPAGLYGSYRVRDNKVYNYSLKEYKDAYDEMCDKIEDTICYVTFLTWMEENQLRADLNAQEELNIYQEQQAEKQAEAAKKERAKELVNTYRAEFENACDYLYYGYGYRRWRFQHTSMKEEEAKIIWHEAFNKMATTD